MAKCDGCGKDIESAQSVDVITVGNKTEYKYYCALCTADKNEREQNKKKKKGGKQ